MYTTRHASVVERRAKEEAATAVRAMRVRGHVNCDRSCASRNCAPRGSLFYLFFCIKLTVQTKHPRRAGCVRQPLCFITRFFHNNAFCFSSFHSLSSWDTHSLVVYARAFLFMFIHGHLRTTYRNIRTSNHAIVSLVLCSCLRKWRCV